MGGLNEWHFKLLVHIALNVNENEESHVKYGKLLKDFDIIEKKIMYDLCCAQSILFVMQFNQKQLKNCV